MEIIARWFAHALLLWVVVLIGQKMGLALKLEGAMDAVITVFLLALANALVRPLMHTMLMPLNCLTLGLLGFAVNVIVLWVVSAIVPGFEIGSVTAGIFCAVMLSILVGIVNRLIKSQRED